MKRKLQLLLLLLALPIGMLAQGNSWQTATLIKQGGSGNGTLDKNNESAWFKIEVPEEGRVAITLTLSGDLSIKWLDFKWVANNADYSRSCKWYMKNNESLIVEDAGSGTYYLKIQRDGGAGSYSLNYQFTACAYANDAEKNDEEGQGSEIAVGQSVQGRIGYLNANDYRDNNDCYKIQVPQDGHVQLIVNCEKTYDLQMKWLDVTRYDQNNKTYYSRKTKWYMSNDTLTIDDAGVGTYYLRLNRDKGHGGYSIRYVFTPNNYTNDVEPNDKDGQGDEIAIGQTVQGHIGYLDANDYRDNDDCYKIQVPQDGRVQLIVNCEKTYDLEMKWLDVKRLDPNTSYYARANKWYMSNDTLTIDDAGVGTYYLHLNRNKGHGGYTLQYIFTPNRYANDAESNDKDGEGTEIANGQTVQGHIGYLDANNYRDNDDCYKIQVPQDGRVQLIVNCEKTYDLEMKWLDVKRLDPNTSYYARANKWYMSNDTLTIDDAGVGTYYLHLNRNKGHGGYTLQYIFTPNRYANDAESNDKDGEGTEIVNGQTVQGHIGYLDANDYRDNDDCYKIQVPQDGRVQLVVNCEPTYGLQMKWLDFKRYDQNKETYYSRQSKWYMLNDTLTIEDAGVGTYYLHLNRDKGFGGYRLKYIFTPYNFPTDTEPNNEQAEATDLLENNASISGHLGYLDANDKRDNEDWIKLDTQNATTMMNITVSPDTTSTLKLKWVDIVQIKGDQSKVVANKWYINEPYTFNIDKIEEGATYYAHLCRDGGHGGYTLTYGTIERAADSKIRITFVGRDKVRLGVPTEYTVKIENIDSRPSTKFFLLVHATDDIKLLGCKLPGKNGVEELPMDSISYDGDPAMVFVVPSMAPFETYSFNIMAEGLVMKDAREFMIDTSSKKSQSHRIVISGTTCLIIAGLVALDYAGDKVTEFMTDVIHDHIDLDEKELAYYREKVNKKVDWGLVEEKTKTGETIVVARRAVKTVATKWLETVPGGGLINFAGELLETTKAFSGAIVRRWLWFTTKDTDANYKEWERKYNEKLLDAKQGINGVVRSFDPNEMVGPIGYGDENYISEAKTMDYQILFENKKDATAPAYRIRISDELDENIFDLNTVRFGSTSHEGVGYNWKMNREGNKLTWDIEGIELPPNVNAPEGEGYVTFSVDLKPGLKNGTQIKNKASIRFDYNEVIETNEYVNTLDLVAPTTKMKSVAKQDDGKFLVTCEGIDSESGVSHYQFYISKDGEDYVFLGNNIEPSLSFEMDQTNANYSIIAYAVDNVGNAQKSAPEALVFNPTGIRIVNAIADDQWTINRLNGTSVAKGKGAPNLDLPAGVYIIRQGNNVRKVIIK